MDLYLMAHKYKDSESTTENTFHERKLKIQRFPSNRRFTESTHLHRTWYLYLTPRFEVHIHPCCLQF